MHIKFTILALCILVEYVDYAQCTLLKRYHFQFIYRILNAHEDAIVKLTY